MLNNRFVVILGLGMALTTTSGWAASGEHFLDEATRSQLSLTLYQQNLALVEEQREIPSLATGSRVILQGVSPQMQAETLQISGAGVVTEQNLEQNLLSLAQLLQQNTGKMITLARFNSVTGVETRQQVRLLKAEGNQALIENSEGHIETLPLNHSGWRLIFPAPAEGFQLQPQLSFVSEGLKKPGFAQLSYLTRGLSWSMDYVISLNKEGDALSLQGLATLSNQSGQAWPEAHIKLLAGTVNEPMEQPHFEALGVMRAAKMDQTGGQIAPGNVQDYHLYALPAPLALKDQQQKQIPLIHREQIKSEIRYHHQLQVSAHQQLQTQQYKASIHLTFDAPQMDNAKTPLPSGQARVFRPDASGQMQFIGGSQLHATAPGDTTRLVLGEAFDVGVEYTQTGFKKVFDGYEVSYEVLLTNRSAKDKPFNLIALMPIPFTLQQASLKPTEETAAQIGWTFDLKAGEEKTLTFTAKLIKS
ncbi:DUF4139 domain-containing protein [Marinobacterium sediminicola]|uniref:DUF4139 domain-containing protein n=1 Tax=Marinobacterium sediminicola TaxID=518898 RepID=A0ABY1RWL6_9GAMM|nr:DUF4139 domain-containing protein [Marinobacterium sediminicola]ULG70262.1 DUF4139 domain-containing protein [Marinobacterium sediminicola]SMR69916.1 hypothetical protein SAMN04487964_101406 [Marinobacterium sediminicola]